MTNAEHIISQLKESVTDLEAALIIIDKNDGPNDLAAVAAAVRIRDEIQTKIQMLAAHAWDHAFDFLAKGSE